jgi:hypothetical protein
MKKDITKYDESMRFNARNVMSPMIPRPEDDRVDDVMAKREIEKMKKFMQQSDLPIDAMMGLGESD